MTQAEADEISQVAGRELYFGLPAFILVPFFPPLLVLHSRLQALQGLFREYAMALKQEIWILKVHFIRLANIFAEA
ncbi:MAG TPA: hypothetical protein VEW42_05340 [Candidatus Eisenbacteria bacterium]|nr:hypothetical protein [Candidatus Eisenbacteria bacterium]